MAGGGPASRGLAGPEHPLDKIAVTEFRPPREPPCSLGECPPPPWKFQIPTEINLKNANSISLTFIGRECVVGVRVCIVCTPYYVKRCFSSWMHLLIEPEKFIIV